MRLFRRTENRNADTTSYSDALVDLIVSRASGDIVKASATAALESCAGIVSRAFASAEVEGPPMIVEALGPQCRAMIGRALIRRGEMLLAHRGGSMFPPASAWTVYGHYDPTEWTYLVHLAGPSRQVSFYTEAGGVLHFRYVCDPARPWSGIAPLESAALAGRLSAETVAALGDEASGTRGVLLPVPVDGQDDTVAALRGDLASLKGRTALVESANAYAGGPSQTPGVATGWQPQRLGADPPAALVEQARFASAEVMEACGISPGLWAESGTVAREAWRQTLHGVISPLGELVAAEISDKTGEPVRFSWAELRASDIMSRARAVGSMVTAGASLESAAMLAGLDGLDAAPMPEPSLGEAAPEPVVG